MPLLTLLERDPLFKKKNFFYILLNIDINAIVCIV